MDKLVIVKNYSLSILKTSASARSIAFSKTKLRQPSSLDNRIKKMLKRQIQHVKMIESQTQTMIEILTTNWTEKIIMTGVAMRMTKFKINMKKATAQMKMTLTTVTILIFGK